MKKIEGIKKSIFPEDEAYYEKMGLSKEGVEPWEDGMRTDGGKNTYEWWYYDFHFDDGSKLVIVFYTKNPVIVSVPLRPLVTLELTLSDGRKFYNQIMPPVKDCSYSKEGCDVDNGKASVKGDLKNYEISFVGPSILAKVSLTGSVPPWRPKTGNILFGDEEEHYFAWLPAVPEGRAVADLSVDGERFHLEGTGYHDHNWGNISMFKLMHHWYWGRAKVGDYTVISSWITAGKEYGFREFDIFMLAKGDKIIGDNSNHTLKFKTEDEYLDKHTGKLIYNKVIYEYETEEGELYRVTYHRKSDIAREFFYESIKKPVRFIAKAVGFTGSYQRFQGSVTIEKIVSGQIVESITEESAVWELMYFS